MIAKDLMTARPFCVTESDSVRNAAELMLKHEIGFIPVVDGTKSLRLAGVITDRDIAIRCVAEGLQPDGYVATFMTKGPLATVRPESPVDEVIQLMERARVRRIPVVDQKEKLVGIVALADVVRALGRKEPGTIEGILERVSEASRAMA